MVGARRRAPSQRERQRSQPVFSPYCVQQCRASYRVTAPGLLLPNDRITFTTLAYFFGIYDTRTRAVSTVDVATHRVHDVMGHGSCMMCTPTSHGATGGKIPSFPTASASKSLRLEYGYSGHHTETDHVIRSGSLDCRRVAIRPPQPARARASTDVRCGAYLGRKRRVQTSVALRPFAFTNLTTRVVTHLKLPIMHQGQPDCAHVASVRARTGQHEHTCAQSTEITHSTKIH